MLFATKKCATALKFFIVSNFMNRGDAKGQLARLIPERTFGHAYFSLFAIGKMNLSHFRVVLVYGRGQKRELTLAPATFNVAIDTFFNIHISNVSRSQMCVRHAYVRICYS